MEGPPRKKRKTRKGDPLHFDPDPFSAVGCEYDEKTQARVIMHMIKNDLGPNQAFDGENDTPGPIPRATLYRWWKHFEWYGELPVRTRKRYNGRGLKGSDAISNEIL